jgi:methionyl-tRNA formyltransferase
MKGKMAKRYKVIFMGTPEAAATSLRALLADKRFEVVAVLTQTDKPVGRKGIITPSPVKVTAESANIPVLQPTKLRSNPELWQKLRDLKPDIFVVTVYGKILPQEVLDIPEHGVINIHPSFLPKYRGASPVASAILNGDSETGVTLMKLTPEMDAGPIIMVSDAVQIAENDTTASLAKKLAEVGANMLLDSLPDYLEGKLIPQPQDDSLATYVTPFEKENGKIDWTKDEEYIERMTRAYNPWPGTYTIWNNKRIKIISATVEDVDNPKGQVKTIDNKLFIGRLKINLIQPEGKSPMSGIDFLRGYPQFVDTFVIQ